MSGPFVRRDLPVTSAVLHLDNPIPFPGHDKRAPPCFGGTCLSGPFVRRGVPVTSAVLHLDNPIPFPGHDKRAPPKHPSEGFACQVRLFGGTCLSGPFVRRDVPVTSAVLHLDSPIPFTGHDKRAPPKHPLRRDLACQVRLFGGTCLSRPLFRPLITHVVLWPRQGFTDRADSRVATTR
ncbi:MAG: hypothetical protein KatS3mg112_0303 [Thermogutta sp.]|nr:MAG: hypothetical protein KatS3mg112_0303 [Thermogutta sp.]